VGGRSLVEIRCMAMPRLSATLLLVPLTFLSCLAWSADGLDADKPDAKAAGMNAQRLSEIPLRMKEYVDAHQTAGTVTIVARHGKVAGFEAVGYQDIESKKPMRKDSLFRIASLTKPITCAGVMVLVDAGKISVIDPVEKFLPEYKGLKVNGCEGRSGYNCPGVAPSRPINIEDLMKHTSGLPAGGDARGQAGPPETLAELASLGAKLPLLFEPGTAWNYSNVGYNILGRIIEVVSKQPYDQFLEQHIFEPLGMKDTAFFPPEEKLSRLATLYTLTGNGLSPSPRQFPSSGPKVPMPAGGLVSSAEDILRFNMMMRNKGVFDGRRVLSAAAVTLMTTSHTGDMKAGWAPGVGHGYGYEVVRNADGMFRYNSVGSFAKGGAFRTYEFVDPEKDLVGVFMMQLTNGGGDTADEINSFMAISAAAVE
jgi:CubicO group peptidase (beta-lactamase class C family)